MAKPVLLTVDDDPEVLRAIERDLRRHYADRYRVLRADSAEAALQTLRQLKTRNDPVALLLADQRMPQMDGVGFLSEALQLYPEAKRALLTAYADTDAAIRAINEVKIHHYLLKPWDPPEEQLYPVIDDLLDDWTSTYRPPFEGLRVLGNRWSPKSYEIREFLARPLLQGREVARAIEGGGVFGGDQRRRRAVGARLQQRRFGLPPVAHEDHRFHVVLSVAKDLTHATWVLV